MSTRTARRWLQAVVDEVGEPMSITFDGQDLWVMRDGQRYAQMPDVFDYGGLLEVSSRTSTGWPFCAHAWTGVSPISDLDWGIVDDDSSTDFINCFGNSKLGYLDDTYTTWGVHNSLRHVRTLTATILPYGFIRVRFLDGTVIASRDIHRQFRYGLTVGGQRTVGQIAEDELTSCCHSYQWVSLIQRSTSMSIGGSRVFGPNFSSRMFDASDTGALLVEWEEGDTRVPYLVLDNICYRTFPY